MMMKRVSRTMPQSQTLSAVHIDMVRGIAAILVMINHVRIAVIKDTHLVPNLQVWQKSLYFLTSLGPESVIVFFALSGYLVGSSVIQSIKDRRFSTLRYFIARFSRIYTVLIPSLLIGAALDFIGLKYFSHALIYSIKDYNPMFQELVASALNYHTFYCNALNLQEMYCHTFGSNRPLWSLSSEWWYYMLFPVILIGISPHRNLVARILSLILATAILANLNSRSLFLFPIWVMGSIIPFIPPVKFRGAVFAGAVIGLVALLAACSLNIFKAYLEYFSSYGIGLAVGLVIYLAASDHRNAHQGIYTMISRYTSNVSYTLYATHMPLVTLLTAIYLGTSERLWPNAHGIAVTICFCLIVMIYATTMWYMIERNTPAVRQFLTSTTARWSLAARAT